MKRLALTGAVLLSSLLSFNAMAAQATPEETAAAAADTRQAAFKLLSYSFGKIGGMARGAPYDGEVAKQAAKDIATLAAMLPGLFEADTRGFEVGGRYMAADTIWANKADFDQIAADLAAGANEALGMLESQGEGAVRGIMGKIGPNCGACHDRFRVDR